MVKYADVISRPYRLILAIAVVIFSFSCQDKQNNVQQVVEDKTDETMNDKNAGNEKFILFFGNSLTAGYGLEDHESFPSLVQGRIDSLELNYKVVNAGLSGETTAGGLSRINWVLKQQVDIFVLELGGNDILRGLDVKTSQENLRKIILSVKKKYPDIPIILAGMQAPPNMGNDYTKAFNNIYTKLSNEFSTGLIPFLLDGVAGLSHLNLPDGIHPNPEGQKIVLENVWSVLSKYM